MRGMGPHGAVRGAKCKTTISYKSADGPADLVANFQHDIALPCMYRPPHPTICLSPITYILPRQPQRHNAHLLFFSAIAG